MRNKGQKRKRLTHAEVLERLRECWEKLRFDRKLTKREEDLIGYNFNLVQLFIGLTKNAETEHTFACGFEYSEYEEEIEDDEEEKEV